VSSTGRGAQWRTVRQRAILRLRPRLEKWQDDWTRASYSQALPHLRADTALGRDAWIIGGDSIYFGAHVRVGRRARLQTIRESGGVRFDPKIELGDRVSMEDDCHIGAVGHVVVEPDVMIASRVLILDHAHDYRDVTVSIAEQPLRGGGLRIGRSSHIGENVCILGPLTIGRHCVVGAGAVLLSDVPDFTVVAGVPARPIKRHDAGTGQWVRL
jgi:acetyltransferase-like isoleucine patch superfamily enzyme